MKSSRINPYTILRPALITVMLLSLPTMAMLFDWRIYDPGETEPDRLNWSAFDFIAMGVLIFLTGLSFELLKTRLTSNTGKFVLAAGLIMIFLLVWAELAVGAVTRFSLGCDSLVLP